MTIRGLLIPTIMLCAAAVVRVGVDPITVTRTVGQQILYNVQIMVSSSQTATEVDIGYDPELVTPALPGGVVNGVTLAITSPGVVHLAWTGAPLADGAVLYSVAFNCIRAGTTSFQLANTKASDKSGPIPAGADSKDTLLIRPKPITIQGLLQP